MIHKAWWSIEEVPDYFSRSYIKFQGHTGWKIDDLDKIWARLLDRSQLSNPSDLPCSRLSIKFQGHTQQMSMIFIRIEHFWTGLQLPFEFPDDHEMMHKAWSSIEEVLFCFSRLCVNFQGHMGHKIWFWPNFGTVTPVWIHQWLWNGTKSLT